MKTQIKSTLPAGVGIGLLVCILVTVIGTCGVAWLLDVQTLNEENVGYGTVGILLSSSFIGALVSAAVVGNMRLPVCMITGCCYMLVLLATTALFFDCMYEGVGVTALVIAAGSACSAFLGGKKGKKPNYGKRNPKNR